MSGRDRFAIAGAVIKPHGIKGELIVEPGGDPAELFRPGHTVTVFQDGAAPRVLTIEKCHPHQGRLILALEGIRTRNEAEELRGRELQVAI